MRNNDNAANEKYTTRGLETLRNSNGPSTNGSLQRTKPQPALPSDGTRLARIKAKSPQFRTSGELAYEEAAELGEAFPDKRGEAISGLLSGVPSLASAIVIVVPKDAGRCCFASAVCDPAAYFGEGA